jgi:hypothetical protein
VCRGCTFTHDIEFAYPLPNRYFSECWVFCLVYKSLECVAVEFEADDRGKAEIEDTDKGTCFIQRRNSASVSISKHPYRHVYMLYQDEAEKALRMSTLATNMRVNSALLRYYSACNSTVNSSVCSNTYGSYLCLCNEKAGYIPSPGNGSCVKAGEIGTYRPASSGAYRACPNRAWTQEGATSAADCYCPSGSDIRVTTWSNTTTECVQCGAGLWSDVNSTCGMCYPNSWSLPGTVVKSNCLCKPGFYMDLEARDSHELYDADGQGQCAQVRGTDASPCVRCPKFSNTTAPNASSLWDCTCNPGYVRITDPGDPTSFVCAPEDKCAADQNPCPGGGKAVCRSSPYEYWYACDCNPGEGFGDRSLDGGFCVKMWYFKTKVDLDAIVDDRPLNMYAVVQSMEISDTQNLKALVDKSRSKMFGHNQYVVVEFAGKMAVELQAFYVVSVHECVCVYKYVHVFLYVSIQPCVYIYIASCFINIYIYISTHEFNQFCSFVNLCVLACVCACVYQTRVLLT